MPHRDIVDGWLGKRDRNFHASQVIIKMRWRIFAFGLGIYAVALILTAPATLLDAVLQSAGDGRLRLSEAQGTLWSGAGQLEILEPGRLNGIAKNIAWSVRPASLLRGRLDCDVELDQSAKRFPVTISLSRVGFTDADIHLPAAVISLAVPKLAPLGLTGDMLIHVASVSIARDGAAGNATLQWRAAGSALTPISPLGEYEMDFDAVGSAVHAALRTVKGPVQLAGKGTWSHGAAPSYFVTARVPALHQEQLAPFLRLIGKERGAGIFEISSNDMAF
jgi:general secretion pathway protein N